ncbi:hypothetical protein [Desulfovibrio sp. X2]|uniref:hypothetical protein n=1 Tax=Desulfovibrio sp. X2 TaxID=941449 RepID=UPI000402A53A|nr:hypothetical protein [Desulfovibrio sp. X2]
MAKKVNPTVYNALSLALAKIYWYKRDFRRFLSLSLSESSVLNGINWDDIKINISAQIVERLAKHEEFYKDLTFNLIQCVINIEDFSHLKQLDDGQKKEREAIEAVNALKKLTKEHFDKKSERELYEEKSKIEVEKRKQDEIFNSKMDELKSLFFLLGTEKNKQNRGYELEKLINSLFEVYDLYPRASYKSDFDQIDGSFVFENMDYLLECKWTENPCATNVLDIFKSKIGRCAENTLGLLISINGVVNNAIDAHSGQKSPLLLMDGVDLLAVLERRVRLDDLLFQKRRHSAQTGRIFFPVRDMGMVR